MKYVNIAMGLGPGQADGAKSEGSEDQARQETLESEGTAGRSGAPRSRREGLRPRVGLGAPLCPLSETWQSPAETVRVSSLSGCIGWEC